MKIVFVDGYNILNSWPNLKEDKEVNFQGAREKLIDIMHNYGSYYACKIVIVFDGHKVSGNREKIDVKNKYLTIVFTKDGQTADAYIEKEVHSLGRKYEVQVVTSDKMEQQTVFQRGAIRTSSLEFYNEVIKTEQLIREKEIKTFTKGRNDVFDNVPKDIQEKLEAIRRS